MLLAHIFKGLILGISHIGMRRWNWNVWEAALETTYPSKTFSLGKSRIDNVSIFPSTTRTSVDTIGQLKLEQTIELQRVSIQGNNKLSIPLEASMVLFTHPLHWEPLFKLKQTIGL